MVDRTPMQQGWCGSVALTSRIGTGSVDVKQGNMVAKPVDLVFSASHRVPNDLLITDSC